MIPNLTPFERWLAEVAYDAGGCRVSPITGEERTARAWLEANAGDIRSARRERACGRFVTAIKAIRDGYTGLRVGAPGPAWVDEIVDALAAAEDMAPVYDAEMAELRRERDELRRMLDAVIQVDDGPPGVVDALSALCVAVAVREGTMGDQIDLLNAKRELREAAIAGREAVKRADRGRGPSIPEQREMGVSDGDA